MNDGYVDRLRKGASLSSGISPIFRDCCCWKIQRACCRTISCDSSVLDDVNQQCIESSGSLKMPESLSPGHLEKEGRKEGKG